MDNTKGTNEEVKETPQSPMPSEEQKTTGSEQQLDEAQAQSTVKDEQGLPDDASERTRRNFERLTDQLREERTRREYFESVFTQMNAPKPVAPTPVYDPATGLINENVLTDVQRRAQEAEERARRAEAAVSNFQHQQEERDAYTSHPELKDESFKAQAEGIMYHSQVNPQKYGAQFNLNQAATYLKGLTKPQADKVKAQAQKEALETIEPKEQASLTAEGGNVKPEVGDDELEALRYRSRRGDIHALAERLHKVPASKE